MEKVAGHTATPWGVERCEATPCYHIEAGAWPYGSSICRINENPNAEANAAFIVQAVNSHDELVKLLQEVLEWNEDDADLATNDTAFRLKNFADTCSNRSAAIRKALSRATKQEG